MRFIRQRFVLRVFSIFSILLLLNTVIFPTISYALTTGPHQPEYTSYEDASASDMVNLLTGDFNYTMPILSVPIGNEGNFTVPLSYHAGVSPDMESSWVGLGFNVNVGSITRNINGYPDDANGESQTINVKNLNGPKGWYANGLLGAIGWDSQAGHYGSIKLANLSYQYNGGGTTVGIGAGIYLGKNARFDAVAFGSELIRAVAAVLTEGESEVAYLGENITQDVLSEIASQGISMASFASAQSQSARGNWEYTVHRDKKLLGAYSNYWYTLNKTRIEDMYGILNLDKAPPANYSFDLYTIKSKSQFNSNLFSQSGELANKGSASDINIDLSSTGGYQDNVSPTLLAYDNFYVNGPGISGSIKPYRLEVGSVSVPREMSKAHIRMNPVPYLDYGTNKIPFVYAGSEGNSYYNHVGSNTTVTSPNYYFDFATSASTGSVNLDATTTMQAIFTQHTISDATLLPENQFGQNLTARKRLPQGQYVDWLTNSEIKNTTGRFTNSSYMDCFSGAYRTSFRNAYSFGGNKTYFGTGSTSNGNGTSTVALTRGLTTAEISTLGNSAVDVNIVTDTKDANGVIQYQSSVTYRGVVIQSATTNAITLNSASTIISPASGHVEILSKNTPKADNIIGGFVITRADGMNYHYSIPVYDYNSYSSSVLKTDTTQSSSFSRSSQFANTWLLTAITGPDFVDRGGSTNDGDGYIDENDWGYWVKFNYGSQSTNYMWRFPYLTKTTTSDSQDKYNSYSQGFKEMYYLNSIETRSHVALFLKGSRNDAKDASASKLPSLRLCEIALLTKDSYKQLIDPLGVLNLQDCAGTKDVLYQYTGSTTGKNITASQESFIQANALKRVIFNSGKTTTTADYTLCQGALNSDVGYGKLTLNSISILGRNNIKVLPDYKFTYGNNPAYDVNKWDGFGMYTSLGTSTGTSHRPSQNVTTATTDASAWSLTSIKSPLGHSIDVTYERDSYASISGNYILGGATSYSSSYSMTIPATGNYLDELRVPNASQYAKGDIVNLSNGSVNFTCNGDFPPSYSYVAGGSSSNPYSGTFVVQNVSSTSIFLSSNFMGINYCDTAPGDQISVTTSGSIQKAVNKSGGNLRVGSITLNDNNGQQYKTRYLYDDNGLSTGVLSVEPDYIRTSDTDYPFYKFLNYPATPVLYGKVSVLVGKLSTDTDYSTKTVYEFETPNQSQYSINSDYSIKNKVLLAHLNAQDITKADGTGVHVDARNEYSSIFKFQIDLNLSKIGKLKSIKTYGVADVLPYSSQDFIYTQTPLNNSQNNYQGIFTEGTVMFEMVTDNFKDYYHKDQRTTVMEHPYFLQKIVTKVDGQTTESTNTNWDLITGNVVEKQAKSPLGIRTKTVYQPVYTITGTGLEYYKLGSKAIDPSYKNMLSQIAATYNYLIDDNGNELGLLGASATTWKKDWATYSVLNGGTYTSSADLDLNGDNTVSASETAAAQVWRKSQSYVWIGDKTRLNSSGVHNFSNADKFDFANSATTLWKKTGSVERLDHSSQILETKDIHGISSSSKYGYNNKLLLASAVNASYYEMAYSGAEDRLSSTSPFFGGEVSLGAGSVVTTPLHTGKLALSVSSGGYGFVYKTPLTTGILANKKYRVSVWTTNSTNGKIYYKIGSNGVAGAEVVPGNQTISSPITFLNNGTWYRLDAFIDIGNVAVPSIEVGVKSLSGTVVFDDFRFQPADAAMSCNVYNPVTYNLEYVLNNDNVYTRYEYNDQGVLVKTYIESMKTNQIGERLVNETKSDYKRFHRD